MKKINLTERGEITIDKIHQFANYVENNFTLFLDNFLQVSSGVIVGLNCTQNGASGLLVSSGAVFQTGLFGELESSSGVIVSLPVSGTRTDLLVAYYEEVLDTPSSGKIVVNTTTRVTEIQTNPSRKLGAAKIELLSNTLAAGCPSNRIPLYEIASSSSTITTITDVKAVARIQRLQTDIQQDFYGLFYAGF
jgi:hypothetical protein